MENLFINLFKYKTTEKNISPLENFTTEILKCVIKKHQAKFFEFLNTKFNLNNFFSDLGALNFITQEGLKINNISHGIADILIENGDKSISFIIENKIWAAFGEDQREKYLN